MDRLAYLAEMAQAQLDAGLDVFALRDVVRGGVGRERRYIESGERAAVVPGFEERGERLGRLRVNR